MKSFMNRAMVILLVSALAVPLFIFAGTVNASAKAGPIILRVASPLLPPPADISRLLLTWAEKVKARSGGRVDFKYYWGGSLVTAPESLSMLSKRAFDIGIVCWLYQPGITPLGTVDWAVPFNTESCTRSTLSKQQVFKDNPPVMEELTKHHIKPLLWYAQQQYWLYTKFAVNTLADLKGRKIGCAGRDIPVYLKAVDAIPVSNVAAEKYEMLQRGVTDGDCMSFFQMTDYKVYEVVKYLYTNSIGRAVTVVYAIHDDAWKLLPEDVQKIMIEEARETEKWQCQMEPTWVNENLKKWSDAKVVIGTIPQKEIVKWAEKIKGYPQQWADDLEKKGLPGKKVMRSYLDSLEELGEKMPIKYTIK